VERVVTDVGVLLDRRHRLLVNLNLVGNYVTFEGGGHPTTASGKEEPLAEPPGMAAGACMHRRLGTR
jgi:hypothetical protein